MDRVNAKHRHGHAQARHSARVMIVGLTVLLAIVVGVGARTWLTGRRSSRSKTAAGHEAGAEARAVEPAWRRAPSPAVETAPTAEDPARDNAAGSEARPTLAKRFDSERRDTEWAARAERDIRAAFFGFPQSALQHVECRASVCSLSVSHGDAAAYDAWAASFARALGSPTPLTTAREDQADGTVESKNFFAPPARQRGH